jgi:hypothetical protein
MWKLDDFCLSDMVNVGAELRRLGRACRTMEELGQSTARFLYEKLVDRDGRPALALARFFKTHAHEDLPPDLQRAASDMLAPTLPWAGLRCLTLLGTAGDHVHWRSRRASRGHQAIPLRDSAFVNGAPMIAALARQLGVEVDALVKPTPELFLQQHGGTFNVFHVADALGSGFVPAQKEFIAPYGVRSVLGLGGVLPTGEIFATIMFSKCTLPASVAPLFKPLALSLRSAVLDVSTNVFA